MSRFGLFCGFGIDYAVPLPRLLKILPRVHCYVLPKLPAAVTGVIVVDGQLVPQLDLAKMLPGAAAGEDGGYQVLVESECGTLALLAEQSCGIVAEQKGAIIHAEEQAVRGLSGEFCFQRKNFQILDIDSLAIGLIQESW